MSPQAHHDWLRAEGDKRLIFVGNDWAEDHHDIEVMDDAGVTLARRRLPEGVVGVGMLHAVIAEHSEDAAQVVVGI